VKKDGRKPRLNRKIIKKTPFGPIGIIWVRDSGPRIIRVLLSTPDLSAEERVIRLFPHAVISSSAEIDSVAEAIRGFLEGEEGNIPQDAADWSVSSPFQQSVLRAESGIPRGSVSTYRLIAEQVGKPNGARAVGTALAHNPFPLIVLCHRAIRSDRHLGGYQGGLGMKRALLEMEGLPFDDVDRVACEELYFSSNREDEG
jgi:methylated-DNA-[protein]-cysteine S-methyltransferase